MSLAIIGGILGGGALVGGLLVAADPAGVRARASGRLPSGAVKLPPVDTKPKVQTKKPEGGIPWAYKAMQEGPDVWAALVRSPRQVTSALPDKYGSEEAALDAAVQYIVGLGGFPVAQWPGEQPKPVQQLLPGEHHVYLSKFYQLRLPDQANLVTYEPLDRGAWLSELQFTFNHSDPWFVGMYVAGAPMTGSQKMQVVFYNAEPGDALDLMFDKSRAVEVARFTFIVWKKPWYQG